MTWSSVISRRFAKKKIIAIKLLSEYELYFAGRPALGKSSFAFPPARGAAAVCRL